MYFVMHFFYGIRHALLLSVKRSSYKKNHGSVPTCRELFLVFVGILKTVKN